MAAFELVDPNEINELACELASDSCRSLIECSCGRVSSGNSEWYDTATVCEHGTEAVEKALRYLALLGNETAEYRLVRSSAFPRLVKFVDKE